MARGNNGHGSTIELTFLALAFYWGAALLMKFGFFSQGNLPGLSAQHDVFGSLGLLTSLVVIGLFPKLITARVPRTLIKFLPFITSSIVGICVFLHLSTHAIPDYVWMIIRYISTVGLGCVLAQTGPALVTLPRKEAAKVVAGSFCFGVLVSLGSLTMELTMSSFVYVLFTWLAAGAIALIPLNSKATMRESGGEPTLQTPHIKISTFIKHAAFMPKGFWSLFFGLTFFSVVYGISLAIQPIFKSDGGIFVPTNILLLVASLGMALLMFKGYDRINLRLFQWFLFVPIVIGLFPLPIASNEITAICSALLIISFTCYDVANIVILTDMSRELSWVTALRVFVWGRAANVLGMALGGLLVLPFASEGHFANTGEFSTIIFLAILILVIGMAYLGRSAFSHNGHFQESDAIGRWRRACEEVGVEYGLSPREMEIMILVAKGRNAEYIGDKLFIAASTAKSHTYRIYQKLEIHSQQELMTIIEERITPQKHEG